jgi:hypothetical protein
MNNSTLGENINNNINVKMHGFSRGLIGGTGHNTMNGLKTLENS